MSGAFAILSPYLLLPAVSDAVITGRTPLTAISDGIEHSEPKQGVVMLKYRLIAAVTATAASLLVPLAPTAASAAATAPEPVVTAQVVSVNGSGCPSGTSAVANVPSQEAFTLSYSQFRVAGGDYKSCVVAMNVAAPAGWTYAIYQVDNRGYGILADGSSAKVQTNSWFTGFPWTMTINKTVYGPLDDFWQTSTAGDLVFAPCNRSFNLNITNVLRVYGPSSNSMELFAQDVRASIIFHLQWRQC